MTDMTKAIFSVGWIAPYYNEEGWRDAKCDLFVKISDDRYLPIVLRDEAACLESEMPIAQAKALIDALQRAVAEWEDRQFIRPGRERAIAELKGHNDE